jgi:twitching motility two-component system response regulator PilG
MQGTLQEIDIRSLLQILEFNRQTGELYLETVSSQFLQQKIADPNESLTPDSSQSSLVKVHRKIWMLYLVDGQITYATSSDYSEISLENRSRQEYPATALRERLYTYNLEKKLAALEFPSPDEFGNASEYNYIWFLLKKQILNPTQAKELVRSIVEEILFDLLDLTQGFFLFKQNSALTPQLVNLKIAPLIKKTLTQIKLWKQFFPHIKFLEQCLIIKEREKLSNVLSQRAYKSFLSWTDGKTTLRQLFRYLNCEPTTLAQAIYPYLKKGWLKLTDERTPTISQFYEQSKISPQIVYINNDVTIGGNVEYILKLKGCRATLVERPIQELDSLFQLKPDLILCDSTLSHSQIDGCELCGMLRNSQSFRSTPIIMLTEGENFVELARSKLAGATDYLSKPFQENELLMLIEKYISLSNCPNLPQSFQSLSLRQEKLEFSEKISSVNLTES